MKKPILWVWGRIAHPKIVTIATLATYAWLLYGWVPGLINPPSSLEGMAGTLSMYIIGGMVVLGAGLGIPVALVGQNRVERWTVKAIIAGIAMYVVVIHLLHFGGPGNRLPQAGTIGALLGPLALRLIHVYKRPIASGEEVIAGRGVPVASDLHADNT
ncbi:hypothetical protein [Nesterenkonia rhizosphaerae]|uniref:Uncharacterized protein n=1 Tax=Nesterenkonia rhizosphaerae TaxID=1348272 RepID=A0ABP9G060_9MICC